MIKYFLFISIFGLYATAAYGALAGGRPNAFSEGNNAFAGVINPANAVWIPNRFDLGVFWVHQKLSITNYNNNPLFPPGKLDLTYRSRNIFTPDIAIHKQFQLKFGCKAYDSSFSLAAYTMPNYVRLRTKQSVPLFGNTPMVLRHKIDVISAIFSFKLNASHSFGVAIDYFYFSELRNGFQNSDNPLRSVSPGNVTNNGYDHSSGFGFTLGWRWNITERLKFGAAWAKKNHCGRYKKYQGFEPWHGKNYTPQTLGAGFSYAFTPKLLGKLDVLWVNLGHLPRANNNINSDGTLNLNRRGSDKGPGPGLQDATLINVGMGYIVNPMINLGVGFSHRIKLKKGSNFLSHIHNIQTIFDILSLGANFKYEKHDVYLVFSYGFRHRDKGFMPRVLGGGQFAGEKQDISLSLSYGYLY